MGVGAEQSLTAMRRLKDKEVRGLLREFIERYPKAEKTLGSAEDFDELTVGEETVYFVNGVPLILRTKVGFLPSLKFDGFIVNLPQAVVDMGAVAHVVNGADIMRPGVKSLPGDFGKGDLLVVVDEKYGKPIALGIAEFDSVAMRSMVKGKVIRNVHFVGDELWNSFSKPS